ncbi:MFS transporter [Streptomyces sp. NPDC026206]|uniref:MFS transporter n=1 Tax=Streptomyces sp. NPDC026206 TaxID=3157089 RepID=UPI0033F7B059
MRHVRLLRSRSVRVLWLSMTLSVLGDRLYGLAAMWVVYAATGSSSLMGLVAAVESLPCIVLGGARSVMARFSGWSSLAWIDAGRAAVAVGVPLLWSPDVPGFAAMLVLVLLLGALTAVFEPNLGALIPQLVEPEEVAQVSALFDLTARVAAVVGQGCVGVLLQVVSEIELFAIDGFTFAVSAVALAWLGRRTALKRNPPVGGRPGAGKGDRVGRPDAGKGDRAGRHAADRAGRRAGEPRAGRHAGEPRAGGPGVRGPGAGEPRAGEPGAGGPGVGGPWAGEPGAGEPGAGGPRAGGPGAGEPRAEVPGADGPGAGGSGVGEPHAGEPRAGEPGAGEPHAGELHAGGPHAGGPWAGVPGAGEPRAEVPGAEDPGAEDPGAGESRADGLRVVRARLVLREHRRVGVAIAVHGVALFAAAVSTVGLPPLLVSHFGQGAAGYGLTLAATGAGGLAGNLLIGHLPRRWPWLGTYCLAWTASGLSLAGLGVADSMEAVIALCVASGLLFPVCAVTLRTHLFRFRPAERLRLLTVDQTATRAAGTAGMLLLPYAVDAAPAEAFVGAGALLSALALAGWWAGGRTAEGPPAMADAA